MRATYRYPSDPRNILDHLVNGQYIAAEDDAEQHGHSAVAQRNFEIIGQSCEHPELRRQANRTHVDEEEIDKKWSSLSPR
jgi:hypothetical protein